MEKKSVPEEARTALLRQEELLRESGYTRPVTEQQYLELALAFLASNPLDCIKAFHGCISSGITPPAQVLIWVAENFDTYLASGGQLTLDEAFDLKSVQGSGHPLKAAETKERRVNLALKMWALREEARLAGTSLSIQDAAVDVTEGTNTGDSAETMERFYKVNDVQNKFDQLIATLRDTGSSER